MKAFSELTRVHHTGAAVRRMCAFPIPPFSRPAKALPTSAHGCPVEGLRVSSQLLVYTIVVHRRVDLT